MKKLVVFLLVILTSCSNTKEEKTRFTLKNETSGITFENTLTYTEAFNPYTYRNFYNGGGVAIGDLNNDGLNDIYFTGNMVDNKLYINQGNWQFKDITTSAGIACPNIWSTGATFVDINADGFLDIYVCKSGIPGGKNRHNELFINNGDLTFTEQSKKYGLAIEGLSIQASFFDYDKDGDLDAYILNNSVRSIGTFALIKDQRNIPDANGSGNKFFRNDDGKFKDITEEAGIYTSKIGFGLGITLGDFNKDSWTDIFISNDFFEKDYLYLNNQNGGFTEDLESCFQSISMGSMGADFADLDNDNNLDLMVTEMLPKTLERQKTKTVFESYDKQNIATQKGYYNQFARNTLQKNLGNNNFVEIGRQKNIAATEWSWGTLFFDADNDGNRDIFVSNGIYKDLLDQDFLAYEANDEAIKNQIQNKEKNVIKRLIDKMPSKAIANEAYKNLGDFKFENQSKKWGLDTPSFSNGSAYADLDNDGDLDLVVNNINMPAFVYENKTDTTTSKSIVLKLKQKTKNTQAVGAKVKIKYNDSLYAYGEHFNSRGFQSSIPYQLHFGTGNAKKVDSLWVEWPNGKTSAYTNLKTNKTHVLMPSEGIVASKKINIKNNTYFEKATLNIDFQHKENKYIDFNKERLLTKMHSNDGPAFTCYDLNNDNIDDLFFGGAKNQASVLYLSSNKGYKEIKTPFENDAPSEATGALFFDADNDGDMDLYVCHGGKAFSAYSTALNDVLYINENNTFIKSKNALTFGSTFSSSTVTASDFDKDGDLDLFVGERFKINTYGLSGSGYILKNNGTGKFTIENNTAFTDLGMITNANWCDINNDGWDDLVIVGEWMPITIFINTKGKLTNATKSFGLENTSGLWTALHIADADDNGNLDIIAGNLGTNTFFEPDMRMYISDFDGNGFKEQIICKKRNNLYYPIVTKDELISQMPSLKKKLLYYNDYAQADMTKIFSEVQLSSAKIIDLNKLESTVFYNKNGKFKTKQLPQEIQYSPVYAITSKDINEDGKIDLFFGGNQYLVKPQFGRYDASFGWAIFGPLQSHSKPEPLNIKGQIRDLEWINYNNKNLLIAPINNEKPSIIKLKE